MKIFFFEVPFTWDTYIYVQDIVGH